MTDEGNKVVCAECGNDSFSEGRKMTAYPEKASVVFDRTVWVCTNCDAQLDLRPWMAGEAPDEE